MTKLIAKRLSIHTPFVVASCLILACAWQMSAASPIRIVVWDEQQPQQRMAYSNFLGNEIVAYLKQQPGLEVTSKRLNDPNKGLGTEVLDAGDVLVWWGHVRQTEITPAMGQDIVRRIKSGKLALIALHSAHWSTPFVEAMKDRARDDALKPLSPEERRKPICPRNGNGLPANHAKHAKGEQLLENSEDQDQSQ